MFKEKTEFSNIILEINNGILKCEYKEDSINIEKAKQIIKDRLSYTEQKSYPALIKSINKIEVEKSARAFFKSKESSQGLLAIAMMATNSYSLIIMNFMIRLYKPNIPIKMFNDETKALEWLTNFII